MLKKMCIAIERLSEFELTELWQPTPVFLPWKIPRIAEPSRLWSIGLQRVDHD